MVWKELVGSSRNKEILSFQLCAIVNSLTKISHHSSSSLSILLHPSPSFCFLLSSPSFSILVYLSLFFCILLHPSLLSSSSFSTSFLSFSILLHFLFSSQPFFILLRSVQSLTPLPPIQSIHSVHAIQLLVSYICLSCQITISQHLCSSNFNVV